MIVDPADALAPDWPAIKGMTFALRTLVGPL
jgi:hypothetical protein